MEPFQDKNEICTKLMKRKIDMTQKGFEPHRGKKDDISSHFKFNNNCSDTKVSLNAFQYAPVNKN